MGSRPGSRGKGTCSWVFEVNRLLLGSTVNDDGLGYGRTRRLQK
jgi:hypothetical protein